MRVAAAQRLGRGLPAPARRHRPPRQSHRRHPVGNLAGNVALSFVALSYAGRLTLTVHADAAGFPDLPALLHGIRQEATALDLPVTVVS
jgi:hypothetical protein